MKNSVLITGASGQLGREWQNFFAKMGVNVTALSSNKLDITNPSQVEQAFVAYKPDYVINCAAYTAVDKAEEDPLAFKVNRDGVKNLALSASRRGIKVVHYSTDYVFSGSDDDRIKLPAGYPESHPCEPINAYGKSKWEGEKMLREYCEDYIIIRVSWLCGLFGNNFVKTMLRLAGEKDHLRIINDQFGAPTFTENVVENTVALLQKDFRGVMHVSSSGLTNWYEFAEMIFAQSNKKISLEAIPSSEYPTPAKRPAFSKLDISRLKRTEGAKIVSWNEGLEKLLLKLRKNKGIL